MKNKEEDYLDTLLNIVSDEKEEDSSNGKSSKRLKTPENEFLKEFEEELNSDEDSDYLHEFEMELQADERRKAKPRYTEPEPEEKPKQPEPESKVEEAPAELKSDTDAPDADTQNLIDGLKARMEKIPDTKNGNEEPDLAGNGSADILDILAGDGKLSDIKDMLSDDGTGSADSGSSAIDDFAQKEMAESPVNKEKQEDAKPDEKKDKKEKKPKKAKGEKKEGGLLAKLAHILFHEADEDVESVTIKEPEQVDVKELSDENQQILRELEESEKTKAEKRKEAKRAGSYSTASESPGNFNLGHGHITHGTRAGRNESYFVSESYIRSKAALSGGRLCRGICADGWSVFAFCGQRFICTAGNPFHRIEQV